MTLVAAGVDGEHRLTATGHVPSARHGLGERGEDARRTGVELLQLNGAGDVGAHEQSLTGLDPEIDIGQQRPSCAQQRANGVGGRVGTGWGLGSGRGPRYTGADVSPARNRSGSKKRVTRQRA